MDFLLTEEQRMLKDMVEDFGREQISINMSRIVCFMGFDVAFSTIHTIAQ